MRTLLTNSFAIVVIVGNQDSEKGVLEATTCSTLQGHPFPLPVAAGPPVATAVVPPVAAITQFDAPADQSVSSLTVDHGDTPQRFTTPVDPADANKKQRTVGESSVNKKDVNITEFWKFDMVQKCYDGSKKSWRCLWCNTSFSGWNATKVMYHLCKVPKKDIKPCPANIDDASFALYRGLLSSREPERCMMMNSVRS